MAAVAVYLQPAFILQHRPYRETSLLLDVFTRDVGVVPMLVKGVRKENSKMAGLLLPFTALKLSFADKSELKVLTQIEYIGSFPLQRLALYCGFYVNELLQLLLHKHDPHPEVFGAYRRCLGELAIGENVEQVLRYFELELLQAIGYECSLAIDSRGDAVQSMLRYRFIAGVGLVADGKGCLSGDTLSALASRLPLNSKALLEAKLLLRQMLDEQLQGRPLKSREVLAKMIKYL